MMETQEFEAKTTEEAIEKASTELDLPVEELNIDIIEPGSAGIFGLVGGKKAKIKVTFKEAPKEPITETESLDESSSIQEEDSSIQQADESQEDVPSTEEDDQGLIIAKEALEKILSLIPVDVTVNAQYLEQSLVLKIEGDKSGLLIGRRGKTLDALQFIVNKIVNKALERKFKVTVDSENYRQRRKESLVELAERMGDRAKRTKKTVTTNPMNPRDRRIVHLALKEDRQLDTRSRGEGVLKKVMIIPKR